METTEHAQAFTAPTEFKVLAYDIPADINKSAAFHSAVVNVYTLIFHETGGAMILAAVLYREVDDSGARRGLVFFADAGRAAAFMEHANAFREADDHFIGRFKPAQQDEGGIKLAAMFSNPPTGVDVDSLRIAVGSMWHTLGLDSRADLLDGIRSFSHLRSYDDGTVAIVLLAPDALALLSVLLETAYYTHSLPGAAGTMSFSFRLWLDRSGVPERAIPGCRLVKLAYVPPSNGILHHLEQFIAARLGFVPAGMVRLRTASGANSLIVLLVIKEDQLVRWKDFNDMPAAARTFRQNVLTLYPYATEVPKYNRSAAPTVAPAPKRFRFQNF